MKFEYDAGVDAGYIYLDNYKKTINKTIKLTEDVLMDVDKDGNVLGIEILDVKKNNPDLLKDLKIGSLVSV
ncbi:DUF2283 domain-containing protein [Candidatus Woesearchaeota archaeon]|nr:DUF2283 domain-containing protein [Candidatus Woesearchaeota archaeon]